MGQRDGRRVQPRGSRVLIGSSIVLLVIGAAGVSFLLLRDDLGRRAVPDFSFQVRRVNGASIDGAAPPRILQRGAHEVQKTLNTFYLAGFIDPSKWEDGTFPEVLELFEAGAVDQAQADLPFLTLGEDSTEVEFIEPAVATMTVRLLVDRTKQLTAAAAVTRFVADGEFEDGRSLFVRHAGTFYLRPGENGGWLIVGYRVTGEVQPGRRQGGPRPTTRETG
jgi:hypothetical protein